MAGFLIFIVCSWTRGRLREDSIFLMAEVLAAAMAISSATALFTNSGLFETAPPEHDDGLAKTTGGIVWAVWAARLQEQKWMFWGLRRRSVITRYTVGSKAVKRTPQLADEWERMLSSQVQRCRLLMGAQMWKASRQ